MRLTQELYESIKKTIQRLRQLRQPITINERDLHETFMKSSGPGGQNVNKRDTCVRLTHLPTGASVKCMLTRHQEMNRREARRLLVEAVDNIVNGDSSLSRLKMLEERERKRKKQLKSRHKYNQSTTIVEPHTNTATNTTTNTANTQRPGS